MSAFNTSVIVYINGIKFSPICVSVSACDGSPISFSVDMPAVPEWDALPERSHAVVFFADPISNAWRMMCEGEYIGYNKSKSAQGSRRRTLLFRGLHGMWDTIQAATITGVGGVDGTLSSIIANSQIISTGDAAPATTKMQTSLREFLVSLKNSRAPISILIPAIVDAMVTQSPIDTFYNKARRLLDKTFSFEDTQINQLVNVGMMSILMNSNFNETSHGKSLSQIVADFENMALYHHVPLLCPPLLNLRGQQSSDAGTRGAGYNIPEVLYIPHLYGAIPPACNVIFTDQIVDVATSRNYLGEPTRIIVQVETGVTTGDSKLPAFVMVNSVERAVVTNDVLKQSSITFRNDRSSDSDMRAGIVSTHDLLTTEEYHRGVIPHFLSLPLENVVPVTTTDATQIPKGETRTGLQPNAYMDYLKAAARSHFESIRAGARSANVVCAFQPYIAVGFPCLIEDKTGPFWGIVSNVVHTMSATSAPMTSIQVSHIREAYSVQERLRNVPLSSWICDKFHPDQIENKVYSILFGKNVSRVSNVGAAAATSHATMLPPELILASVQNVVNSAQETTKSEFANKQVNLDELAKRVMYIPSYSKDFARSEGIQGTTIADNVHGSPDPGRAALEFQFRPGVTISQYAEFHKLGGVQKHKDGDANDPDYAYGKAEPENLDTASSTGHELFGAPQRMVLMKDSSGPNVYGPYELASASSTFVSSAGTGLISPIRQNAAKMIKAAIAPGITEG